MGSSANETGHRTDEPQHEVTLTRRYYLGEILGKGVLDLRKAVRALRQLNYDGWISVEYEGVDDPHNAFGIGLRPRRRGQRQACQRQGCQRQHRRKHSCHTTQHFHLSVSSCMKSPVVILLPALPAKAEALRIEQRLTAADARDSVIAQELFP